MAVLPSDRLRSPWRNLSRLDRVAVGVVVLYVLVRLFRVAGREVHFRVAGREVPLGSFIGFLFFLCLIYFSLRLLAWGRKRLLWSLKNRLIVAYLFIAVVPVLLILAIVVLSAWILYMQLGAYLLYEDLQKRVERTAIVADTLAASLVPQRPGAKQAAGSLPGLPSGMATWESELPGMQVELNRGREVLERFAGPGAERFAGIVQTGAGLSLKAVAKHSALGSETVVAVTVPVTSELLEEVAPELGPIQLVLTRPAGPGSAAGVSFVIGNQKFRPAGQIGTLRRTLQAPTHWLDYEFTGVSKLEAFPGEGSSGQAASLPVFASFSARPSQLSRRLLSSLGELGGLPFQLLILVGILFLVLEIAALITGIVLTRTITHAVSDLYQGTQRVQTGDLGHRVRIPRKDQLGALGESFNSMTGSISTLIEEQRQRQRLENELSIAREVQAQLFPRSLPSLPGIQLEAFCRAARMVSGDYYDFIPLGPTQLGIALADISGKGISAALLMASLQASLRNQVQLAMDSGQSTAEVVARLNRHLFLNTSEDRYATLFYAVYDSATQVLRYTNAGHLPPIFVAGENVRKLEEGGIVVGLFEDAAYQEGRIRVERGSLLVAYSDGLTEPENVYGEEFGGKRLVEIVSRHREAAPRELAESLVTAVEEWAASPEQADDMTVIVARLE